VKTRSQPRALKAPPKPADEIPEDIRAELYYAKLQVGPRLVPPVAVMLVPEDVLAEQDAADRALVEERSDDARRVASISDEDSP
jgi:hypothetical protein